MDEITETPLKNAKGRMNQPAKTLWWNAFWPGLALACLIVPALPIFGGCMFIQAPEPEPAPTKVPDVPVHPDTYKPVPVVDAATIKPLTDESTDAPNLTPDFYQLVSAETGDRLTLQAYRLTPDRKAYILPLDKPVKVKLGGIICPLEDEPGWAEAKSTVENWLKGRRLQVDEDRKYPITIDGRNIVQIRIKSNVKTKSKSGEVTVTEEERPFNQVLVRAGYAFVDLVSPTSFNYKAWIVDEEYARGKRNEPAEWQMKNYQAGQPTPKPAPGIPVGLWARGIYPKFRGPVAGKRALSVIGADAAKKRISKETVIKNP